MSDDKKPGMVSRGVTSVVKKGRNTALSFLIRFLLWGGVIAALSEVTANYSWPWVYDHFGGAPLNLGEKSVYSAVRYGAAVASIMGGASVALAGMIWKR